MAPKTPINKDLGEVWSQVNDLTTKVAVLEEVTPRIEDSVKSVDGKVDTVIKILQGNSKEGGLVTCVSNNSKAIKRAYGWLSGITTAILIFLATVATKYFKG